MGMFDYIRCHGPLPDGWTPASADQFQTKSLENMLDRYRITTDGRLEDAHGTPCAHTGDIVFYTGNLSRQGTFETGTPDEPPRRLIVTDDDQDYWWREYQATFHNGRLQSITGGVQLCDWMQGAVRVSGAEYNAAATRDQDVRLAHARQAAPAELAHAMTWTAELSQCRTSESVRALGACFAAWDQPDHERSARRVRWRYAFEQSVRTLDALYRETDALQALTRAAQTRGDEPW